MGKGAAGFQDETTVKLVLKRQGDCPPTPYFLSTYLIMYDCLCQVNICD